MIDDTPDSETESTDDEQPRWTDYSNFSEGGRA